MKIRKEERDIGPEEATQILERHWKRIAKEQFRQRPISQATIHKYIMEMKNGDWRLSPDEIAFDTNEDLINGQHRLEAVRRSGKSIRFNVSYGWDPDTIKFLDQGKPRSIGQLLHMAGVSNGNATASTVAAVARVAFRGRRPNLTLTQTTMLLEKLGIADAIVAICKKMTTCRDFVGRVCGPIAYYYSSKPNKALAFAESYFQMEMKKNSPVAAFARWMKAEHGRGAGRKGHQLTVIRAVCAALRAWDENREIQVLKPTSEAVEWLANTNEKLRDHINAHVNAERNK